RVREKERKAKEEERARRENVVVVVDDWEEEEVRREEEEEEEAAKCRIERSGEENLVENDGGGTKGGCWYLDGAFAVVS
ncbi:MAG: hypothetical protein M1835_007750, partial [Candelina submexicana]